MHNIDRQMRVLQMNGVLDRCKGIILGEFTDCGSEFTYESVEAMLHNMLAEYNIPVLCGYPGGHGDVNLPIVMGAPVTIDVRNDGATLQFNIEGNQYDVNTAEISAVHMNARARMMMAGKREAE
jgi:muramoyltetrapeptide carboxypeptidase